LDLFDYFSQYQSSTLSVKEKAYEKIVEHLDKFIKSISIGDKQL
jgi:hypothetical protein